MNPGRSAKAETAKQTDHGMLNAYWEPLTFELPRVPDESQQRWRRCVDTALVSPEDFYTWEKAPSLAQTTYVVQPRSVVFLVLPLQAEGEGLK